jgi:hypothetical protein
VRLTALAIFATFSFHVASCADFRFWLDIRTIEYLENVQ